MHDIASLMSENGIKVTAEPTIAMAVERGALKNADWIALDIDSLGGIVRIYDAMRGLRDAFPDTPVILLSREFGRNDYGVHRLALGDVSLRVPFTVNAFEIGLLQAQVNNKDWQRRVARDAEPQTHQVELPTLALVQDARHEGRAPMQQQTEALERQPELAEKRTPVRYLGRANDALHKGYRGAALRAVWGIARILRVVPG
jgi:hypothetical protein